MKVNQTSDKHKSNRNNNITFVQMVKGSIETQSIMESNCSQLSHTHIFNRFILRHTYV